MNDEDSEPNIPKDFSLQADLLSPETKLTFRVRSGVALDVVL